MVLIAWFVISYVGPRFVFAGGQTEFERMKKEPRAMNRIIFISLIALSPFPIYREM